MRLFLKCFNHCGHQGRGQCYDKLESSAFGLKKVEVQEAREFGNENSVLCESGDETRMTWDYIVKFNANASDHVRYEN